MPLVSGGGRVIIADRDTMRDTFAWDGSSTTRA